MSLPATSYKMFKVREDAITQEINMSVQPLLVHLHPDRNKFEHWVLDRYQDQTTRFMVQDTIKEGKPIIRKFWHHI